MSGILGLIDVNDDGIIQIFSLLPFADLVAVRGTCRRFRHLSEYTFSVYPKRVEVTFPNACKCDAFKGLKTIFKSFGSHIRELTFNGLSDTNGSQQFLNLLQVSVDPSKLKSLKLIESKLTASNVVQCQRILENLEVFELFNCTAECDGVFEAMIMECQQLRGLSLIDLLGLNGHFLASLSTRLESIELQNVRTWENANQPIALTVGPHTKCLILRHIYAIITCPSNDLSNLETLKLDLLAGMPSPFARDFELRTHSTSLELLSHVGNGLKHLHLSSVTPDGVDAIARIGNRLESFSLDNSSNVPNEYIFRLLENNRNLRSVKLCHMGDECLYREVPRRVRNVEELCIWPARKTRYSPIGTIDFAEVLTLTKLKSFTFFSDTLQTCELIGRLAQMHALETLGFSIEANDFNENFDAKLKSHFSKLKNLKTLKLALYGRLNWSAFENIATQFVDLKELKLVHGDVATRPETHYTPSSPTSDCNQFTNCSYCGDAGIHQFEFRRFIKHRLPIVRLRTPTTPLKIYQTQRDHSKSVCDRVIAKRLRRASGRKIVQLHPLSNDGFFEFFTAHSAF